MTRRDLRSLELEGRRELVVLDREVLSEEPEIFDLLIARELSVHLIDVGAQPLEDRWVLDDPINDLRWVNLLPFGEGEERGEVARPISDEASLPNQRVILYKRDQNKRFEKIQLSNLINKSLSQLAH